MKAYACLDSLLQRVSPTMPAYHEVYSEPAMARESVGLPLDPVEPVATTIGWRPPAPYRCYTRCDTALGGAGRLLFLHL
jgi:hypothetical protein